MLPSNPVLDRTQASFWKNLTGFHNGPTTFHNLSSPNSQPWSNLALNLTKDLNQTEVELKMGSIHDWSAISKVGLRVADTPFVGFERLQAFRVSLFQNSFTYNV